MKTLQANNLDQAIKELSQIDPELAKQVKPEVRECDRGYYHAILVRIEPKENQVKNKVLITQQIYNKPAFEQAKKSNILLGISSMIVLHDPSLEDVKEPVYLARHEVSDIKAKVEKELKEKMEKEYNEKLNAALAEAKAGKMDVKDAETEKGQEDPGDQGPVNQGPDGTQTDGDGDPLAEIKQFAKELEEGTGLPQMHGFAKDHEIDVTGLKTKEEVKGALSEWIKDKLGQ